MATTTIERGTRIFHNRQGMRLLADEQGPEDGPLVLFLHGGGQTRQSWGKAVAVLGDAGFHAITLDLRGHGESDWAPDGRYDLQAMREDLLDVLATLDGLPALVGASLGGLTALLTAGLAEAPVARALVLVDVVPHIEMEGGREIRDFMAASPNGFASVDEAADAVAAYLPHRPRPSDHSGLMRNLRLRDDGRYHWHWDPKMIHGESRLNPADQREALERASRQIAIPTLLVRGGRSRVVSMDGVRAFQQLIPHAEFVTIDQADHMVAGDANDAFNAPLLDFLERTR
jgi:pimeloyl-ACP methyl ester carboxylesterase